MDDSGDSTAAVQPLLRNGTGHHAKSKSRIPSAWLKSAAKWTLKTVMWILLVFWIALFFMVPNGAGAEIFDGWVTATEGTLFGSVGIDLLLYGGPILLIAVLAVPYLLLCDEDEEQLQPQEKKGKPQFRLGTFPVLVDGIFGVVSAGELIVIALFVFFVIWAVYNYSVTNYAILPSYGDLTPGESRVQMLQMTAYIFGLTASTCLAFLFLPVARGSILLRLVDIPFEHATKYHIWLGNLTMALLTLHGTCYMIVWIIRHIVLISVVEWKSDGGANCAGIIAYSFGFVMWVTTFPPIRKRYFELFFYTHQLYVFFIIFFALHVGDANFSKIFGGVFLFMLDRFLRFFQSRRNADIISATCFPGGTVGLVISKPKCLHYNALGFIFIRIKELSKLQWHPFSVSSSPQDGKYHLSVLIKVVGEWTEKLIQNVSNQDRAGVAFDHCPLKITANVEGPYGHESPYHIMYEKLILVAGGSGISPFIAILSDILHRVKDGKPCLPRQVLLVWAIKKSSEISLLSSLDIKSIHPILLDKLQVEIRIFVTQESQPSLEEGRAQNFVISSRSTPFRRQSMSILVGTGDKLWAGAYVLVPILGFILITGLLDVFYLNPYDISAWWYRGILLVICMVHSVVIFGGLVIALWSSWEKKILSVEEDDDDRYENFESILQNEELSTKDVIRDFESFTNINYGTRPDFREIFGEVSESWGPVDVGVVVCGPQTLQSSVARECRSQGLRWRGGGRPIFHFNSHSFDL